MRQTLAELRLARGLKQEDLARMMVMARSTLAKIESGARGVTQDEILLFCEKLQCIPEDLDIRRARPGGRPARPATDLVTLFRTKPQRMPTPEWTDARRLEKIRSDYSNFVAEFDDLISGWWNFLREVHTDSTHETLWHLRELRDGAQPAEVSTDWLQFTKWPVRDDQDGGGGCYLRPTLVTRDWLAVPQVTLAVPGGPYRVDALVVVRTPVRRFCIVEIDGPNRDVRYDRRREIAIGLPTIRIPNQEVLTGPSLTERLLTSGAPPG